MLKCLEGLIGLYSGNCECISQDEAKIYPFYVLDDMDYSIPLTAVAAGRMCGDGGVIEEGRAALVSGANKLVSTFQSIILDNYKPTNKMFSGSVGQLTKASSWKTFGPGQKGLLLKGKKGEFKIESINVKLKDTQDVVINISDDRGNDFDPIEIEAVGGRLTRKYVDLTLPLVDEFGEIEYKITYDFEGEAYNIKYSCGCSDDNYRRILPWFSLSGINGNAPLSKYTHGLVLTGNISCSIEGVICSLSKNDSSKMALSRLLQLYAINSLISKTINSSKMNVFTTLNKPSLNTLRNEIKEQIEWRLKWIFEKTDLTDDCWQCQSDFEIEVAEIDF